MIKMLSGTREKMPTEDQLMLNKFSYIFDLVRQKLVVKIVNEFRE